MEGYTNPKLTKDVIGLVGDVVSVYGGRSEVVKTRAASNLVEQSILAL